MMLREIAGETLLIPLGAAATRVHGMVALSESGVLLWRRLQNDCTEEDLVEVILAEYEIDRDTAGKDVQAFLQKLDRLGILCRD